MARLVVMRAALGPEKFSPGDVVDAFPDGASVGKKVSLEEWEKAGGTAETFPALFYVIDVKGLSLRDARALMEAETMSTADGPRVTRRRQWTLDLAALNASKPLASRTLETRFRLDATRLEAQPFISRK